MALTASQQARLDKVNLAYTQAIAAYEAASFTYNQNVIGRDSAKAQYLDCQAKRDAENSGWAKNRACDINALSSLGAGWNTWEGYVAESKLKLDAAILARDQAKKDVDAVTAAIKIEVDAAIHALETDPVYKAAKDKADAEIAKQNEILSQQKRKTILIFIAVIIVVAIIGFVIYKRGI